VEIIDDWFVDAPGNFVSKIVVKNLMCNESIDFSTLSTFVSTIQIDSTLVGIPLCFNLFHYGASEFFIDGELVSVNGRPSATSKNEVAVFPFKKNVMYTFAKSGIHTLRVNYSNHNSKLYSALYNYTCGGFEVYVSRANSNFAREVPSSGLFSLGFLTILGVLLALSLLHLLIYFFYREQNSNFYYFLFAFCFALMFILFEITNYSDTPHLKILCQYLRWRLLAPIFYFLLLLLCSIVTIPTIPIWKKRIHQLSALILLPLIFIPYLSEFVVFVTISVYIFCACATTGILLDKAKKQNIRGMKIVRVGLMCFIYFSAFYYVTSNILNISVDQSKISGVLAFIVLLLGILSVPISMSVYLAYNFAFTNRELSSKLKEVEELSALTIEQERQRKKLLEEQNEELDKQVKIRTAEVVAQKEELKEKNKEIIDSINYAKRIQQTLLAHEDVLKKNLPEYFIYFDPKDIVSGDFYWASSIDERNEKQETRNKKLFYLAICDSTGHGVPGAFMSLLNIGFLTEAINEKGIRKPNEVLNFVRQRLIDNISKDGQKDGFDGILICIEKSEGKTKVSYAAANNAPVLVRNNELKELDADRMPVGVGERKDDFKNFELEIQKGDILYLYTDGFADQFGGPKGKKFKYKQLNDKLIEIHPKKLSDQQQILSAIFHEWKGELEQIDDVCVAGIRF
jgi:serine phosphatase RsbU (regulator of sigma subunit)